MKKIFYYILLAVFTFTTYPQKMVVQKTDGSNLFIDLNTIDMVNFIVPCPGTETVDYEGKTYNTIQMGNQCWLKENLNVGVQSYPTNNGIIEKYCYNNSEDSCTKYGGLYYWQEAMQYSGTEGAKGICPTGWHIPTQVEYIALVAYVNNSGNALKRDDQGGGSGQGTNTSGFSGLLAGGKQYSGGPYIALGEWGSYWMSKPNTSSYAYTMQIMSDTSTINIHSGTMISWGMSVRCIKDN
jgi:uncharacterized protein (TIGR02145 family)